MRLLNIETLQLETFYGSDVPEYAALSHTWGTDEVSFQDLATDTDRGKKGWTKIFGSAKEAKKYCCKYIWVDTCCIDKTSSAELSEAINSMFRWYQESKVCLAYLEDVYKQPEPKIVEIESDAEPVTPPYVSPLSARAFLHQSRWFKRGWTLQELIAPKTLYFYDSAWNKIGEKGELEQEISKVTGIDTDVLHNHKLLHTRSIAQRLPWASKRETTRIEDIAYCLLGIFKVNMPLLYGEGERAFIRLQEEIIRSKYDHTLFAWNHNFSNTLYGTGYHLEDGLLLGVGILAPHPVAFSSSADIIPHHIRTEPYGMTNRGVQIHLRILKRDQPSLTYTHLAILQCRYRHNAGTAIAIPLVQMSTWSFGSGIKDEFFRTAGQELVEVKYSQTASLERQKVYLLEAEPLFWSKVPNGSHRCLLREYGYEPGVRCQKAWYCQYSIADQKNDIASHNWNLGNKSMTWDKARGAQAALCFSKNDGPAFGVVLSFIPLVNRHTDMGVHVKPVRQSLEETNSAFRNRVSLGHALAEDIPSEIGRGLHEGKTTFPFESRIMTARVRKEVVFDEEMFVLDLLFSGARPNISETTLDT